MKTIIVVSLFVVVATIGVLAFFNLRPFNETTLEAVPGVVNFPASGDTLTAGETYTLVWNDPNLESHTQIFLIDTKLEPQGNSVSVVDRVYDVPNSGTYVYTVPTSIISGTYVFSIGTARSEVFNIVGSTVSSSLQTYDDNRLGFSIKYPGDFILDTDYVYDDLGGGIEIEGVRFTIPSIMATGTNLSKDSYVSVETMSDVTNCSATPFVPADTAVTTITNEGQTYSYASTSDAGAGNRYEEMVYAILGTNPCLAIRYFIHYTVLENYPEGAVTQFDRQALIANFDKIRHSLKIEWGNQYIEFTNDFIFLHRLLFNDWVQIRTLYLSKSRTKLWIVKLGLFKDFFK